MSRTGPAARPWMLAHRDAAGRGSEGCWCGIDPLTAPRPPSLPWEDPTRCLVLSQGISSSPWRPHSLAGGLLEEAGPQPPHCLRFTLQAGGCCTVGAVGGWLLQPPPYLCTNIPLSASGAAFSLWLVQVVPKPTQTPRF